jgi:hypothetical protein
LPEIPLGELHPTVIHGRGHEQTRSIGQTFSSFPAETISAVTAGGTTKMTGLFSATLVMRKHILDQ